MTEGDFIDRLLSIYLAARSVGPPPSPEELCRDRPDLLPELRCRIAVNEWFERLVAGSATADPATVSWQAEGRPQRVGGYVIVGVLGRGGMGVVVEADDETLGRRVALKMMRPDLAADPVARARFLGEARAAAGIAHDHVVPIYHVGEAAGIPFIVMPRLEGETLDSRLAREGTLPAAEVIRVGREAALGLAAAHRRGLIHRDVKPTNLWLEGPAGRVKVLDFGLAKASDASGAGDSLTRRGAVLGTPAYMAPEQVAADILDARADLFSLGAVLYTAATGRPPFDGKGIAAILRAVAEHHPPPPDAINPLVPPGLSDLILRLMAKAPADRPASADHVAGALAALAAGGEPRAATPRQRSRRFARLVVVAVLLAAAGVGGWALFRQGPSRTGGGAGPTDGSVERAAGAQAAAPDPQRRMAEMVLTGGGYVAVVPDQKGWQVIRSIQALPPGRLELSVVNFEGFREPVTDDHLDGLSAFDRLDGLYLYSTRVTDAGLERVRGQTHLRLLWLQGTRVTDSGLVHLARLANLEELYLEDCRVTDDGLEHLKGLARLKKLSLARTGVSAAGVERLKQALPNCEVIPPGPP
jgi:hypothetical protein